MKIVFTIMALLFILGCEESGSGVSSSDSVSVESIGTNSSKFKIRDNKLYSIKDDVLKVYDISDKNNVYPVAQASLGFAITGMFIYNDNLIAASNSGLKVFSLANDELRFIANSTTFLPCQRFIVDGTNLFVLNNLDTCRNYLDRYWEEYYYSDDDTIENYETVFSNGIEVYDISDFLAPKLITAVSSYAPLAFSIEDDTLYVCEGEYGLKVYDINRSDANVSLHHNKTYRSAQCNDLITASSYLYGITEAGLDIYDYNELNVTAGSIR